MKVLAVRSEPGQVLPNRRTRLTAAAAIVAALSVLSPALASAAATCAANDLGVAPLQSDVFYVDIDADYLGSYVGYGVTNSSGGAQDGLWVRLESFTGGVMSAAAGTATAAVPLGPLANGATTPSYAYVKASGATLAAQSHDVVVYRGRPGSGGAEVCRQPQTVSAVHDVIKAAANKVTSATGPSSATLGGTFTLTVNGSTGTIGAGIAEDPGVVRFSPAVAADWPADAFRLVDVAHRLPLGAMPSPTGCRARA